MILSALLLAAPQVGADQYTVEYLTPPDGEVVEVGGMDFLPNGDLLVSTRRGRVWYVMDPMSDNPADAKWHIFAEGLHEGLGLNVVGDDIYLIQRGEISRMLDLDGDLVCDRIETLTQDWGMTGNYHEFAFGLPEDAEGNLYFSLNLGFWSPEWWHGISRAPYRGWILKMAPDGTVTTQMIGPGVNSIVFSGDGRMFVTEPWFTDSLYEIDPTFVEPPQLLAQGIGGLKGPDLGPDGLMYGALMLQGQVVKIDVNALPPTVETI